jgi:hypothetical protein
MKYYAMYPLDAYALGPIEADDEDDAIDKFTRMFGEPPDGVWRA